MLRSGTLLSAPIRIQDDNIPLPAAYSNELQGGLHTGETIAERDALPVFYRNWGMCFTVYNDGANTGRYELVYGKVDTDINNNGNWENITSLSGNEIKKIVDGGDLTVLAEDDVKVTVQIEATTYKIGEQVYDIAETSRDIIKPTVKNRIDLLYLNAAGLQVLQGVEAQSALKPQTPEDSIELSFISYYNTVPVEKVIAAGGTLLYNIVAGYLLQTVLIKAAVDINASAETQDAPGSGNIIFTQPIVAADGAVWLINKMAWGADIPINIVGLPAGTEVYFVKKKII